MNITQLLKSILTQYPQISEFTGNTHIDFTEDTSENYGVSSAGDTLTNKDILGNQERTHTFFLYAKNQTFQDYEQLRSSSFLQEFAYWLEKTPTQAFDIKAEGKSVSAQLIELSGGTALTYEWQSGVTGGPVTYQIPITLKYKVESEDN